MLSNQIGECQETDDIKESLRGMTGSKIDRWTT